MRTFTTDEEFASRNDDNTGPVQFETVPDENGTLVGVIDNYPRFGFQIRATTIRCTRKRQQSGLIANGMLPYLELPTPLTFLLLIMEPLAPNLPIRSNRLPQRHPMRW